MITKSKRALAMSLASAMALSMFAGCSGSGSSTTESSAEANSVSNEEGNQTSANNEENTGNTDGSTDGQDATEGDATEADGNSTMTSAEVFAEYEPTYVPEQTVTLQIFSQISNVPGEQKGWSGTILLDKFNVVVNIVNDSSVLSTMLQTGDMGDIVVWGNMDEDYKTAVSSGYLLNWNKDNLLSQYGAYMEANMSDALEYNAKLNGGNVYGFNGSISLPGSANSSGLLYTWDTRWDLYEQVGEPEINNLDDYIKMMQAFKEIEPKDENGNDTYALSMWPDWDGNMVMYVKAFATAYYGYDEWGMGLYDVRTGEFVGALDEDLDNNPYYKSLKFINQLYQNDLVDPNSMSATWDTYAEKMKAGGAFFSIFNYAGQSLYNTEVHAAANKYMCSLIPNEATPLIYGTSTVGSSYTWSISAKTEYPELCMELIDWLASPEGALTLQYGPRGTCWDVDDDGNLFLTDFGLTCQKDKTGTTMSDVGYSGTFDKGILQVNSNIWDVASFIPNDPKNQSFDYEYWDSMQTDPVNDTEASWRAYTGETLGQVYLLHNENIVVSPATGLKFTNPSKKDTLYTNWSQVATTITNGTWKCIYAKTDAEFDQLWEQMVSDANSYGYDKCVDYSEEQAETRYLAELMYTE
jgi:multiple sugar transport system substrate-binding protein/putative aldouronate transport system substrate-binding protein